MGGVIRVPRDFEKIQDAVIHATLGDTIAIAPGIYEERVFVEKTVRISGWSADQQSVIGKRPMVVGGFVIQADNVIIHSLNLSGGMLYDGLLVGVYIQSGRQNSALRDLFFDGSRAGSAVYLSHRDASVSVDASQFVGWDWGIHATRATMVNVTGCTFSKTRQVIATLSCPRVTISGCRFDLSAGEGWRHTDPDGIANAHLTARGNWFAGSGIGIHNLSPEASPDTIFAEDSWWGSAEGPLDSVGTREVPRSPLPSLAEMRNAEPSGMLGVAVSERVVYAPWRGYVIENLTRRVYPGWNMVSVARQTGISHPDTLFPNRFFSMFEYNTQRRDYDTASALRPGPGYWAFYADTLTISIPGGAVDTVSVQAERPGWVMIGSLTAASTVSDLTSEPPGSILPVSVVTYDPAVGEYIATNSIQPGGAVWLVVSQPCRVILRLNPLKLGEVR